MLSELERIQCVNCNTEYIGQSDPLIMYCPDCLLHKIRRDECAIEYPLIHGVARVEGVIVKDHGITFK